MSAARTAHFLPHPASRAAARPWRPAAAPYPRPPARATRQASRLGPLLVVMLCILAWAWMASRPGGMAPGAEGFCLGASLRLAGTGCSAAGAGPHPTP
ncbi:hypothetical protein LPC08_06495 [Roseomonas sp. OT10]|uniref:hypothetical protein n=1 Tax=Roseomonas cutis TaxID=2897332 RepID=UPI001E55B355|nr:hypothetical protein [Roseomonas sp. OT10]UFN50271.1 hypothetical protein LPC08_06495 [Roseomonas sp. OT10]